jgi:hypothetical protein
MLLYEGLPGFMGRVQGLTFLAKAETGSHLDSKSLIQDKVRPLSLLTDHQTVFVSKTQRFR